MLRFSSSIASQKVTTAGAAGRLTRLEAPVLLVVLCFDICIDFYGLAGRARRGGVVLVVVQRLGIGLFDVLHYGVKG